MLIKNITINFYIFSNSIEFDNDLYFDDSHSYFKPNHKHISILNYDVVKDICNNNKEYFFLWDIKLLNHMGICNNDFICSIKLTFAWMMKE